MQLLKSLELIGFKSFAQKTALDFPGGITAIVGPNGSGKSNVIDAVRWILGEREAKNLRGAKAEDLIFAGTPKRSRMGMAEVKLTFDNANGFFPVDYREVMIQRRIERDSTSKYFLNKAEVRLKDIIDFFAKVRLGTRGLSIINQGSSDLFVRATPEERRVMIEEILGLRQYQLKKHEASRKLKNTRVNAEKVRAMVEEIAPHLRFLKRQTSKWEKLGSVQEELRSCENIYFSNKLKEIEIGKQKFNPAIKQLDGELAQKEKELKILKSVLVQLEEGQPAQRGQMEEYRKKREEFLQKRLEIEREESKLEAKIEFLHSVAAGENVDLRAGELLALLKEIKEAAGVLLKEKNLAAVHQGLENLLKKISEVTDAAFKKKNEIADLEQLKAELLKKLQPIQEALEKISQSEEQSAKGLEHFNKEFREAFAQVGKKKEEMEKLEKEKSRLLFEMERLNLRAQDLENQVSQIGRDWKELQALAKNSSNPPPAEDLAGLERRMLRLRSEIAGIGEVDQALIKEATETENRHNFLNAQLGDLEKAAKDLELLIKDLEEKIDLEFQHSFKKINEAFDKFFNLMFGGGKAKLVLEKPEKQVQEAVEGVADPELQEHQREVEDLETDELKHLGIEIDLSLPRKRIRGLDMLSGGEKSLVSIAALFALISVSPPPFLVLDEVDAALDEKNTKRFADIVRDFAKKTQFILVTHNRATMEAADVLYGVTMEEDGVSKVLSLKLE